MKIFVDLSKAFDSMRFQNLRKEILTMVLDSLHRTNLILSNVHEHLVLTSNTHYPDALTHYLALPQGSYLRPFTLSEVNISVLEH